MGKGTSLLVLSAWCVCAQAGVGEWTSVGVPGASVQRVEYVGGGVALAVTTAGIYRTTNHGANWVRVREIGPPALPSIAVNAANPEQVLITADVLLRSTNGGATVTTVPLGGSVNNAVKVVAFSRDGTLAWVIQGTGVVWRSSDGGATWTQLPATLPAQFYWWAEPDITDRNTLYVSAGVGVYVSRDAGDSWTAPVSAASTYAIAPSRTTAGNVIGINTSLGYLTTRSTDSGANWTPLTTGPADIFRLATGPGARAVAGAYSANVYTSQNDGLTWTNRGRLPNAEAISLSMDPVSPDHILAATLSGIVGSSDGGATWEERNSGLLEPRVFDVAVARDGSNAVYVAASDLASIYRRDPANGTFAGVGRGSTPLLGYPGHQQQVFEYRIEVAPQDGRTLYMFRDSYYGRSTDGGVTWARVSTTQAARALALDPVNPLVAYAGGGLASNLKTVDGGVTWTPITGGLPQTGITHFLVDPANNATVYAVASQYSGVTIPVYKSINGGANWAPAGWTFEMPLELTAIAFEPGRSSTIYLASGQGLFKSTDSAASWTRLETAPGSLFFAYSDVVVDPQSPSIVYASARQGETRRSVDAGATWSVMVAPAALGGGYGFERIALLPGHNARLLGLRRVGGVYEADVAVNVGLSRAPETLTAGVAGTITLTATNAGSLAATRVRITATLPPASGAYSVQGTGATCAVAVRELTCDIGILRAAASATGSVTFTPASAGSATFTLSAYETLVAGSVATVTVNNAPASSSSGGGGGGGGRLDYLLLALLGALTMRGAVRTR